MNTIKTWIRKRLRAFKRVVYPRYWVQRVEDISISQLKAQNIKTILLDVDNTLLSYTEKELNLKKHQWVEQLKSMGFQIILTSNNSSRHRIQRVCTQLKLPAIYFAFKPFPFSAKEALQDHHADLKTTIVIGDQVLTDILLGSWLGVPTLLVEPIDKTVSLIKIIQHDIERGLLKKLKAL